MPVDHYDCDNCDRSGVYEKCIASCEKCGNMLCSNCITAKLPDHPYIDEVTIEGEVESKHCPFCSGDSVSDSQRVEFLLEKFEVDPADLDREIIAKRKK